jgi:DNA-binding SARP family transcriptional activator
VLDFRILGPVEVWRDGEPVPLGSAKQRAALALLILEAGRVVSTDRLVDALWGERPPRTASTSLQNFVSRLRKSLGNETLVTKPSGYQLGIQPEQIDAERFRRLCDDARTGAAEVRSAKLTEALAMWRGPPLADFRFASFAQAEIGRLEALHLSTLEERIAADLEAGRHAELVGELEPLIAANPLRERLRGQLMLALYRSGRQAEALQAYLDARRELVDELGIEPTPRLQGLHASILRQDPALASGDGTRRQAPDHRFEEVVATILAGRAIPVLGVDIAELRARLAKRFDCPTSDAALPAIAQYVAMMQGSGPLYDELHDVFEPDTGTTSVHRFLAGLPPLLRAAGSPYQLIVTTNYDLALERAFLEAGEEFDVVSYLASGPYRGKFCHVRPDGAGTPIELPNTYATELSFEQRTVILKLHGQIDETPERTWESFVVTEDDYIDYLAQAQVASLVPVGLTARLQRSHFLFFGYSMADWNLRLLLSRLRGDQPLSYRSWAIQPDPSPLEREFWRRREVDVVELPLGQYVETLAAHLPSPQAAEPQ